MKRRASDFHRVDHCHRFQLAAVAEGRGTQIAIQHGSFQLVAGGKSIASDTLNRRGQHKLRDSVCLKRALPDAFQPIPPPNRFQEPAGLKGAFINPLKAVRKDDLIQILQKKRPTADFRDALGNHKLPIRRLQLHVRISPCDDRLFHLSGSGDGHDAVGRDRKVRTASADAGINNHRLLFVSQYAEGQQRH